MNRKSLCGLDISEILDLAGSGLSHANAIANSLYKKKINDISQFTGIPKALKEKLEIISYPGILKPVRSEISIDKTIKCLFRNEEGLEFETVYIPEFKRHTVCVSTQSGCRMGCRFCATGKYGFRGDLSVNDIITQIVGLPVAVNITHVVFMGMGEPMDNLENVLKACRIITAEWGLSLSPRNVTVSTVGIIPGMIKYLERSECNLSFSLFSPFREERIKAVPSEKEFPALDVIEILKKTSINKKRRFSVAYIMIRDLNDSEDHLRELKLILHKSKVRVNLLPYHITPGNLNLPSLPERMQYFKHELIMSGISASIRKSRGADVSAACGMLSPGLH